MVYFLIFLIFVVGLVFSLWVGGLGGFWGFFFSDIPGSLVICFVFSEYIRLG